MTISMQRLQLTFDGLRREQIEHDWVARGGGLEAYVFDGEDLAEPDQWRRLDENLRYARELEPSRLTLHFPTERADWVNDRRAYDKLRRFCDLAAEHRAAGVTLHANQFVAHADWPDFDVPARRQRVVERLAELDADLDGVEFWVGVENLPVIGSQGIDYDPVFVYPEDFAPLAELGSTRLGVTWDVCHWAVTYTLAASLGHLRQRPTDVAALALPPVDIRHLHFGSFAGIALPFLPGVCVEGVPPPEGDIEPDLLARMLHAAAAAAGPDAGVVLEIQEDDYQNRKHCWTTLTWLRTAVMSEGGGRDEAEGGRPGGPR